MELSEIAERAKSRLEELTGLKPVAVTGAFKDEHGWHIRLDMLEMSRIPTATDVLGDYEVLLDEQGNILRFERRRTRLRGEPFEERREDETR